MIRKIISVIAGYVIFAASAFALFNFSRHDPHAAPTVLFAILTTVYGSLFSFISGFTTQLVAKTTSPKMNYVLAFIIAGFALASMLSSAGNHWTQLLAIFIFAPASIAGGWLYLKRKSK